MKKRSISPAHQRSIALKYAEQGKKEITQGIITTNLENWQKGPYKINYYGKP